MALPANGNDVSEGAKMVVLVLICSQNVLYSLFRRYQVMVEKVSSQEILLVGEILKLAISILLISKDTQPSSSEGEGVHKLIWLLKTSRKIFVLAVIYAAMNLLSFVSLQYISAGEFTVCAQLKVLTTATFSVLILGTRLTITKWRALLLLVLGCITVGVSTSNNSSTNSNESRNIGHTILGYGAVLLEVIMSGFASIYFEKVVKSKTEVITVWERNFQLSCYSLMVYLGYMGYSGMTSTGPSSGIINLSQWSFLTFAVSSLGAIGGLLVAATLKYANSILKTLATSGAIVFSTVFGHTFLDGPLNFYVTVGCSTVIIAIFNYTFDTTPREDDLPIRSVSSKSLLLGDQSPKVKSGGDER